MKSALRSKVTSGLEETKRASLVSSKLLFILNKKRNLQLLIVNHGIIRYTITVIIIIKDIFTIYPLRRTEKLFFKYRRFNHACHSIPLTKV